LFSQLYRHTKFGDNGQFSLTGTSRLALSLHPQHEDIMFILLAPNGVMCGGREFKRGQHNKGRQSYPPFGILSIVLCDGYARH